MTRLTPKQLRAIPSTLPDFDGRLRSRTGFDLLGLAQQATGCPMRPEAQLPSRGFACVPLTAGQGVIPGFAEAVAAILNHVGLSARVAAADLAGFSDALRRGEAVLAADDTRFVAIDFERCLVVDNALATGVGFACALERIVERAGASREVLVLGLGRVGGAAARWLVGRGWNVWAHDPGTPRAMEGVRMVGSVAEGLQCARAVLDATPAADLLEADAVDAETIYVCPGVPCGLTFDARSKVNPAKCLYDPLRLGVATMAVAVASGMGMGV